MLLRSGKSNVPEGNVVPHLHEYVHEIARSIGAKAQALRPPLAASLRGRVQNPKPSARSVAVKRPKVGIGRVVTIALTEGRQWTLLDAELHHWTA